MHVKYDPCEGNNILHTEVTRCMYVCPVNGCGIIQFREMLGIVPGKFFLLPRVYCFPYLFCKQFG